MLIVGELGWPLLDDGRPSNKLSRAPVYGVPVLSERRFLEWIGKVIPDAAHKTYSADQLASLSKLSVSRSSVCWMSKRAALLRQIIGAAISLSTGNQNGLPAHVDH